jgi:predicted dehydrogenase
VLHTVVSRDAVKVTADYPGTRVVAHLDDALADDSIDVIVIATPNPLHAPQGLAALAAGKHVVIDKPFTTNVNDALALIKSAEANGRLLSAFHNLRWAADFLTLQQVIGTGALGEVVQYESHFDRFRPVVRDRWRERDEPGSGIWFDLGSHLIDQALQLFGWPLAVTADIGMQRPGAQVNDYFHVVLRYPTLRVILHGSMLTVAADFRMAAHGTGGSFVKYGRDTQEDMLRDGLTPEKIGFGIDPRPGTLSRAVGESVITETISGPPGNYATFYAGIRDAILFGAPNPVPASQALQVMELLELAVRSATQHRDLPTVTERRENEIAPGGSTKGN